VGVDVGKNFFVGTGELVAVAVRPGVFVGPAVLVGSTVSVDRGVKVTVGVSGFADAIAATFFAGVPVAGVRVVFVPLFLLAMLATTMIKTSIPSAPPPTFSIVDIQPLLALGGLGSFAW